MIIFFINYDKNNNIYNINNYIKNFKDDYNINNNIFDMNILNYKRKNNIYNTHYYINTHVVGRRRAWTRAPLGGGPGVANRALCQDLSVRWC
jgi:hypothetical protein